MSEGALLGLMLVTAAVSLTHWLFVKIRRLEARIHELEKTALRRHTNATAAGLEDALAVNLDLIRYEHEAELVLSALRQRADQQAEILKLVRSGPHTYDEDRAAGKRPDTTPTLPLKREGTGKKKGE